MKLEVLAVLDCPNAEPAVLQVRRALDTLGLHDTEVTRRVITDQQQAERAGFTGSPTILLNGRDPFAEPGRPAGLACRVYRTTHGFAGTPDPGLLLQALETTSPS